MRRFTAIGAILVIASSSGNAFSPAYFTGNGNNQAPSVSLNTPLTTLFSATPWASEFLGGVPVASGDINGDGVPDMVCGQGPGIGSGIRVYDGSSRNLIRDFTAFAPGFLGGVTVAVGDVNGDGLLDIVAGSGPGADSQVRVFDAVTSGVIRDFAPFGPGFTGGVYVAAGDVNADGMADLIVGSGPGTDATVRVFSGSAGSLLQELMPLVAGFTGGVRVGAGDYNGDGHSDVFTASGPGTEADVSVYSGASGFNVLSWAPFAALISGVFVASGDVNGDTLSDVIVHGTGHSLRVMSADNPGSIFDIDVRSFGYGGQLFVAAGEHKATIHSNLILSHRVPAAPSLPIKILQLRIDNGSTFPPQTVLENRSGDDRFWTPFAGFNCNFYLKGTNTIGMRVANRLVEEGLDLGSLTLFGGDINGDDTINIQDFLGLRQNFGSSAGQPGFNPNADIDGNGSVGIGDFIVLRANFGRSGTGVFGG